MTPLGSLSEVLGTLPPSASTNFSVPVTVDSDTLGTVTNEASVAGVESDVDLSDNTDLSSILVIAEADLQIMSSGLPDPVVAGQSLTYTISVTNAGPSDAQNVMVNNAVPNGVSPGGNLSTNLGALSAGSVTSVVWVVSVDSGRIDPITNTASVASSTTDPVPGNDMVMDSGSGQP